MFLKIVESNLNMKIKHTFIELKRLTKYYKRHHKETSSFLNLPLTLGLVNGH